MLCRYFYNMQLGSPEVANVYFQYFRGGKLLPFCWCFVIRYYICFEDDNKNWLQGKYFQSIFELSFCADCDFVVVLDSCLLIGAKLSVMDLQNLFRIRIGSILFIIYDRRSQSFVSYLATWAIQAAFCKNTYTISVIWYITLFVEITKLH